MPESKKNPLEEMVKAHQQKVAQLIEANLKATVAGYDNEIKQLAAEMEQQKKAGADSVQLHIIANRIQDLENQKKIEAQEIQLNAKTALEKEVKSYATKIQGLIAAGVQPNELPGVLETYNLPGSPGKTLKQLGLRAIKGYKELEAGKSHLHEARTPSGSSTSSSSPYTPTPQQQAEQLWNQYLQQTKGVSVGQIASAAFVSLTQNIDPSKPNDAQKFFGKIYRAATGKGFNPTSYDHSAAQQLQPIVEKIAKAAFGKDPNYKPFIKAVQAYK